MEKQVEEITDVLLQSGWIISLAAIVVATIFALVVVNRLYKNLLPKIEKSHLAWDKALIHSFILPFKVLIIFLAVTFGSGFFGHHFENYTFDPFLRTFRQISFVALFLWFTLRFIKNMELEYVREIQGHKRRFDKTTVRAVCQVSRIVAILIGLLVFLQTMSINISAVLAFGGAGGIVAGFAAKDLLSNFFGGLMVYLDRPFNVGDWIRSPDREIEGFVENIGWRLTRIRTFSKRPLYVPNGIFSNISVENPSRMLNRRIFSRIGIRYEDANKMNPIVAEVEELIRSHPEIDHEAFQMVRFDEFGTSSLNFVIYCFTKTVKWAEYLLIQQDVFLKTIEIIEKNGAKCALPTTTLHIPKGIELQSEPFHAHSHE